MTPVQDDHRDRAGVGAFGTRPAFIAPRDVVEVGGDAIGRLRNPAIAVW